jgi:hypothetical protein
MRITVLIYVALVPFSCRSLYKKEVPISSVVENVAKGWKNVNKRMVGYAISIPQLYITENVIAG